jgi:hypothetical protein
MKQLTKEQALTLHESNAWKQWHDNKLVWFQLNQDLLCVGWPEFREAIETVLGRGVHTHEFGLNRQGLINEFIGHVSPPTMDDIIAMIPGDKELIVI